MKRAGVSLLLTIFTMGIIIFVLYLLYLIATPFFQASMNGVLTFIQQMIGVSPNLSNVQSLIYNDYFIYPAIFIIATVSCFAVIWAVVYFDEPVEQESF